jgi:hypothetical protein
VPERDPNDRQTDVLASVGSIASILAGLATLIIAIRN